MTAESADPRERRTWRRGYGFELRLRGARRHSKRTLDTEPLAGHVNRCTRAAALNPGVRRRGRHVSQAPKPYLRLSRRPKASATGGGHSSQRPSDENEVMNASEQQENPVFRDPDDNCDGPSTTPNVDDECVTPKKARTDNQEDYSDATIIDSAEMNCDMEAEDRPFTTVTYKKARPAGIPIIFKLTDPGASFWKVNPNKLASEVVTAAKEKVQSFRVNRDGNFSLNDNQAEGREATVRLRGPRALRARVFDFSRSLVNKISSTEDGFILTPAGTH
ncbi:hypothetical protein MTO96_014064 [Rhipicephalus appendiculatus]